MRGSSSSISMSLSLPLLLSGAIFGACDAGGPGEIGAPCESADDCNGDLICDEHDGQASCQAEHGHSDGNSESESESESDAASESDSHDDTQSASDSHDETDGDDTDHGETEAETEGNDTDSAETGGSSSGSSGGDDDLCEAYCACMNTACGAVDGYPYADDAACLAACESWDAATLGCYGGFCEQAAASEPDLVAHQCEHAWGELGDSKC